MYIIFLKVTIYYRYIEIAYEERESDRKREGGGENKETAYSANNYKWNQY